MTIGDIQAFIQYMRSFTQPITQIANISNVLKQTMAAAERVFEFLAEAEEVPDTDNPISVANFEGRVDFKNVTSVTTRIRSSSTILPSMLNLARRSPLSVRPVPARPPWSNC